MDETTRRGNPGTSDFEGYFKQQDAALIERIRREQEVEQARSRLAEATGIQDSSLLDTLVGQGVSSETLEALRLFPLVFVAWADGNLDQRERGVILASVAEFGMEEGSSGYALLETWLRSPPEPRLLTAWTQYVRNVFVSMSASERKAFEAHVLGLAQGVARASGGLLRGKVSVEEERALLQLRAAFEDS